MADSISSEQKAEHERLLKRRKELPREMKLLLTRIHINGLLPELAVEVERLLAEVRAVGLEDENGD